MPHPTVSALELKPVKPRRFWLATAQHEVEIAVAINVRECGQAVVTLQAFVLRKGLIDEMVSEFDVCFSGACGRNEEQQREQFRCHEGKVAREVISNQVIGDP